MSPLVVLNNFPNDEKHVKLTSTMLQTLFPSIDVQMMKLADARRVVLFNYNSNTRKIEFRHYGITVKNVGLSKSVKNLISTSVNLPNLGGFEDVADFVLRGAVVSESDVEDAEESIVNLSQKYVGRGNSASETRAVRLIELGPRMQLKLMKIQNGMCAGEVVYHEKEREISHLTTTQMDESRMETSDQNK
ncbi:hypothetical protein HK096_007340 [Nowakowskiella sp. JEL0078]|nr:hypothetical protein HK096_007340 [Nowakowskiella sp. JEL0078]